MYITKIASWHGWSVGVSNAPYVDSAFCFPPRLTTRTTKEARRSDVRVLVRNSDPTMSMLRCEMSEVV